MSKINIINDYEIRTISIDDIKIIQELCGKCLDYYILHDGVKPSKEDIKEIFESIPPNKNYKDKFILGIFKNNKQLVGVIDIVKDFPSIGQWMLGLMLIEPEERGNGLGKIVHEKLIQWAVNLGAKSFRIGVIEDNIKGREFWNDLGYKKIKEVSMDFKNKTNKVIVMTNNLNI